MHKSEFDRVILIVLDSLGVGAATDAHRFGDETANTLKHISEWCEKEKVPFALANLSAWGLGHIVEGYGLKKVPTPKGCYGVMREVSPGKDTTTGHWELAGNILREEFPVFPDGFSNEFLDAWVKENNLSGYLCNKPASGTVVLDEFGEEHLKSAKPIVYTSGDSVFQIACSEESFGLKRLYEICVSARKHLDKLGVGRIIARPFVGSKKGEFIRTENRRDYSVPPPTPNLLDILLSKDCFVAGVGKIEDIFAHRSVNIVEHTGRNETSLAATLEVMNRSAKDRGLIFTNLIDFDQLHGHRRNPKTYAQALEDFDRFLPKLESACGPRDLMILSADHGNDPTHRGTDHTRENVPLLIWSPSPKFKAKNLGSLNSFATVARLTLEALGYANQVNELDGAQQSPELGIF